MTRRAFSEKQKQAAMLITGRTGEADHIVPFSKGGETIMSNCQIVTPAINKKKGSFVFQPREWQRQFLSEWENRDRDLPFMLIAIPGGGKTMAALAACQRWREAGADRRIIVVVPTRNLREQWASDAAKFGIDLQTRRFGGDFLDFEGAVVTYQSVESNPLIFNACCSRSPVMVVFDEIHHAADEKAYGIAVKDAFSLSREKLLLSGTPWKSDGSDIPFVRYSDDGFVVGDFAYDLPRALADGVVRNIVFESSRGRVTSDSGQSDELSQATPDYESAKILNKLLRDTDGDFVCSQIEASHRKLMQIRSRVHDAAAMAACIDIDHARKVAKAIKRVTGEKPVVIASDQDDATSRISEFRDGASPWLVSVRQVSEGTDIKRLQVLCYLTNTTTELFFRQLIGRVSRVRSCEAGDQVEQDGFVYFPADPRLVRCAENIEKAQVVARREKEERESRDRAETPEFNAEAEGYTTHYAGIDSVLYGGQSIQIDLHRRCELIQEDTGHPLSVIKAILEADGNVVERDKTHDDDRTKEQRCKDIKNAIHKRIQALHRLTGVDRKDLHFKANQRFGVATQDEMTEDMLTKKLNLIERTIERERNARAK